MSKKQRHNKRHKYRQDAGITKSRGNAYSNVHPKWYCDCGTSGLKWPVDGNCFKCGSKVKEN